MADDIRGFNLKFGLDKAELDKGITEIKRSFSDLNSGLRRSKAEFESAERSAAEYGDEISDLNKAQRKLTANTSLLEKQMAECNTETAEGRRRHSRLVKEYNKESIASAVLQKRIDELGDEYTQLAFKATAAGKAMRSMHGVSTVFDNIHTQIGTIAERFRNLGQIGTMVIRGLLMSNLSALIPVAGSLISVLSGVGGALVAISGGAVGMAGAFGIAGIGAMTFAGMAKTALQMVEDGEIGASAELTRYRNSLSGLKAEWKGLVSANAGSIFNTMANGIGIARIALAKLSPFISKSANLISRFSGRMRDWINSSKQATTAFKIIGNIGPPIMKALLNATYSFVNGATALFNKLSPLFLWSAQGFANMGKSFDKWANSVQGSKAIANFVNYTKTNLPIVGSIFGSLFSGIVSLFQAFSGHSHTVLVGIQAVTKSFKEWAASLAASEGFKNFINYLNTNGPKVWNILKNIGSILVSIVRGMAPIGAKILDIMGPITAWVASMLKGSGALRAMAGGLSIVVGAIMLAIPVIGIIKGVMGGYATVMKVVAFAQKAWQGVLMAGRTIQLGYMMATNGMTLAQMRQTLITKISMAATKAWTLVTKAATIATKGLGLAIKFMTGPVGLIILAITALVGIIVYLWKTNATFRNVVISAWNAIKAAAIATFGFLKTWIVNIWNGIKNASIWVWGVLKRGAIATWNGIKFAVQNPMKALKNTITWIWNGIKSFTTWVWTSIKNVVIAIVKAWLNRVIANFRWIMNTTKNIFNSIKNFFVWVWNSIRNTVVSVVTRMWNTIKARWYLFSAITKSIFNSIKNFFIWIWNTIKNAVVSRVRTLWNNIKSIWNSLTRFTRTLFKNLSAFLHNTWTTIKNGVVSRARSLWNGMKNIWNTLGRVTRDIFNSVRSFLYGLWQKVRNKVVSIAQSLWNGVKSKWNNLINGTKDIFNKVRNYLVDKWDGIKNKVIGFADTIKSKVTGAFGKMRDSLKKIIDKIGGFIGKMVDGVKKGLNKLIDGVNIVGDKLGMGKEMIKPIKLSTGTETSSTHTQNVVSNGAINQPTMAMVNDKGPGNGRGIGGRQELIQKANGTLLAPKGKNALVGLDKGDKVINGKNTQRLRNQGAIAKFSKGTGKKKENFGDKLNNIKGAVGDKASDTAHGISKGAQDLWTGGGKLAKGASKAIGKKIGDIADWASKPGKLLNKILETMGIGMSSFGIKKGNVPYELMGGMFKKLKSAATDLIKSWFEEAEGGDGDAGWLLKHDIWQKFGNYTGGLGFNGGKHYGIDFGMTPGTNVKAVAAGKVSRVWNDYGGGKSMEIDLGGGLTNWYMHLSKQLKKKGDKVGVGDLIAKSGNTGNFTAGSGHLHFELQKNGKPQANVLEWLKGLGGSKKKPSAWGSTIDKAAKKMKVKLSSKERKGIIAQIARESNGDAGVTQNAALKDGNSGANLAQGLLQYVPNTFKAYKMKGHGNIKSGYDQLLAFFNNSNWRKNLPYGKSGWSPNGSRRFATGGIIGKNGLYNLADGGFPEIIIPTDPSRSSDAMKMINYASSKIKDRGKNKRPNQVSNKYKGNNESNNNSNNNDALLQAVLKQNEILTKLLQSNQNIEQKPTGFNEQDVSRAQGNRARLGRMNKGLT